MPTMPTEFRLPELGENIEKGDLLKVLVSVGDEISKDQPVIELETEKATIESPAYESGVLKEILIPEGRTVAVGTPIALIQGEGEPEPAPGEEPAPGARARHAATWTSELAARTAPRSSRSRSGCSAQSP